MVIGWVIGVIIAMFVILILLRVFFKTAFKILSIIWLVLFLASMAFTILVYVDMRDMRENCPAKPPLFLLQEDGELLAGINMGAATGGGGEMTADAFIADLGKYQESYDKKDFDELIESDHCKIAVFNASVFYDLPNITFSEDLTIPNDFFMGILRARNPLDYFIDRKAAEEGFSESEKQSIRQEFDREMGTASKMRGMIFVGMLGTATAEYGPAFAIEKYGERKIEVFKETITFKILKYMPYSIIDEATKGVMEKLQKEEEE